MFFRFSKGNVHDLLLSSHPKPRANYRLNEEHHANTYYAKWYSRITRNYWRLLEIARETVTATVK